MVGLHQKCFDLELFDFFKRMGSYSQFWAIGIRHDEILLGVQINKRKEKLHLYTNLLIESFILAFVVRIFQ